MDMKLIDSRKIEGEYLWQATMDGLFLERDGTVKFCYRTDTVSWP